MKPSTTPEQIKQNPYFDKAEALLKDPHSLIKLMRLMRRLDESRAANAALYKKYQGAATDAAEQKSRRNNAVWALQRALSDVGIWNYQFYSGDPDLTRAPQMLVDIIKKNKHMEGLAGTYKITQGFGDTLVYTKV